MTQRPADFSKWLVKIPHHSPRRLCDDFPGRLSTTTFHDDFPRQISTTTFHDDFQQLPTTTFNDDFPRRLSTTTLPPPPPPPPDDFQRRIFTYDYPRPLPHKMNPRRDRPPVRLVFKCPHREFGKLRLEITITLKRPDFLGADPYFLCFSSYSLPFHGYHFCGEATLP